MGMRLVALIAALAAIGCAGIVQAQAGGACNPSMSLKDAIDFHRSGDFGTGGAAINDCAVNLVKQDIKACLTFYELDECTGPAAAWVTKWKALALRSPSEDTDDAPSPDLPRPSLLQPSPLQWHVPFTKSAVDYFAAMSRPRADVADDRVWLN